MAPWKGTSACVDRGSALPPCQAGATIHQHQVRQGAVKTASEAPSSVIAEALQDVPPETMSAVPGLRPYVASLLIVALFPSLSPCAAFLRQIAASAPRKRCSQTFVSERSAHQPAEAFEAGSLGIQCLLFQGVSGANLTSPSGHRWAFRLRLRGPRLAQAKALSRATPAWSLSSSRPT